MDCGQCDGLGRRVKGLRVVEALSALDATAVRRWYEWGLAALDASRDEINSLNVFPVADADTGTNLYLTLESAVEAPRAEDDLATTALSMARASLLGARGSSGVILSQLLRGVAEVLAAERLPPRGRGLTRALERAVALAYAAVSRPVEGTMLTVARAAAEAARATRSDDLVVVVDAAVTAAHRALEDTPAQLDVLARAGVVDAGGRGVVVLLDVLKAVVERRPLTVPERAIAHPRLDWQVADEGPAPAYEVMYLIDAADDRVAGLRRELDRIGDSVVVSGGGGLWNVHVHTDDAGAAVDIGAMIGHPHRIRVTGISGSGAHPTQGGPSAAVGDAVGAAVGDAVSAAVAALAVLLTKDSQARALRGLFAEVGALVVEPTASAVDELLAIRASKLAVLTETAAEAAWAERAVVAQLAERGVQVDVVAARSPVQLVAALAVHDPGRTFAQDVVAMTAAAAATRHGGVRTCADGLIGAADGAIDGAVDGAVDGAAEEIAGDDPCELALGVLSRMLSDDAELVTVVASSALAERIAVRVRAGHPCLEVATVAADLGTTVWLGVE